MPAWVGDRAAEQKCVVFWLKSFNVNDNKLCPISMKPDAFERAFQLNNVEVKPFPIAQAVDEQFLHGHANFIYESLLRQVAEFENTLNQDEEVGAYLSSFGQAILVQIQSIGYRSPYLIIFYGVNSANGDRVQLVQHTSQLNVLFTALKVQEERPANRIGFCPE